MEGLKIFQLEEEDWYAAHTLMEFLNWYDKNIKPIEVPEDLKELQMFAPEDGCTWSSDHITREDIEALGEKTELDRGGSGNLRRVGDTIYKLQTFSDMMGDGDRKVPFHIKKKEEFT